MSEEILFSMAEFLELKQKIVEIKSRILDSNASDKEKYITDNLMDDALSHLEVVRYFVSKELWYDRQNR